MKTEFTKKQLQEIEKMFDVQASLLSSYYAGIFNATAKIEGSQEFLTKLFKEYAEAFECFRSISARASNMLEEKE